MILIILTVSFLTLLVGKPEAQTSYFPLAVGNRWLYECAYVVYEPTYEHHEQVCKVFVDSTGQRHGPGLVELAITDTVRIPTNSPQRGTWSAGTLPGASQGTLYYILEGREILRKIGLRPPPIWQQGFGYFDGHLIREARTWNEVYEKGEGVADNVSSYALNYFRDGPIEGLIVVGGVRRMDGRWLIFEKDLPLWHLPPGGPGTYYTFSAVEVGGGLQVWYHFANRGYINSQVQVPAGTYTPVNISEVEIGGRYYHSERDIFLELVTLYRTTLYFAEGVGIVRIGGRGFHLVEFVPGSPHRGTNAASVSWGQIKKEIMRK